MSPKALAGSDRGRCVVANRRAMPRPLGLTTALCEARTSSPPGHREAILANDGVEAMCASLESVVIVPNRRRSNAAQGPRARGRPVAESGRVEPKVAEFGRILVNCGKLLPKLTSFGPKLVIFG